MHLLTKAHIRISIKYKWFIYIYIYIFSVSREKKKKETGRLINNTWKKRIGHQKKKKKKTSEFGFNYSTLYI